MIENIRVLIVDDHNIVRDGLEALISAEEGMTVVGTANDGFDAVEKTLTHNPDVVLMDLVMPNMDGVEATIRITQQHPEARILILSSFAEDHQVFSAIKSGAAGYLLKESSSQELIRAIREIYFNNPVLQPETTRKLFKDIKQSSQKGTPENELTDREIEILKQIASGKSNQEIADELVLSERTVRTHITNILTKLNLSNRTQAALYALQEGLAHLDYSKGNNS